MSQQNVLFILSDEHQRDILGCYGDPLVKTPNLDALAARGTRFTNAYTPCPICVPARAALATGRHVHETGHWDNAHPYHGEVPSWHHRLRESGRNCTLIGKLHFRSADDDNGFSEEILPLHVLDGLGDLLGMVRSPPAPRGNMPALAREAGPGESSYTRYDRSIADAACEWLQRQAAAKSDKPWVLFVSFVLPHFPLIAPEEFYKLYPLDQVPLPKITEAPDHPVLQAMRQCMNYADYFDEATTRRAIAAYYGMVSFLDHNIGRVLEALEETGLAANTSVIYTSDHGDNLGERDLWGKSVMYEESVAVPLIVTGQGVPEGAVCDTPVTLLDIHPTVLEATGTPPHDDDADVVGHSLYAIAKGERPERAILSEYHAAGSITGTFMLRHGKWKYVHFVGYRPQLFDLEADPGETRDLATDPAHAAALAECERELRRICDPEAVSQRAFADQARRIAAHGGIEKVMARGDFGYTPAPGQVPDFA